MGSPDKIYQELKQAKKQMNYQEQELQFLKDRIDAIQRHHNKKIDQAKRIIKNSNKGLEDQVSDVFVLSEKIRFHLYWLYCYGDAGNVILFI